MLMVVMVATPPLGRPARSLERALARRRGAPEHSTFPPGVRGSAARVT